MRHAKAVALLERVLEIFFERVHLRYGVGVAFHHFVHASAYNATVERFGQLGGLFQRLLVIRAGLDLRAHLQSAGVQLQSESELVFAREEFAQMFFAKSVFVHLHAVVGFHYGFVEILFHESGFALFVNAAHGTVAIALECLPNRLGLYVILHIEAPLGISVLVWILYHKGNRYARRAVYNREKKKKPQI